MKIITLLFWVAVIAAVLNIIPLPYATWLTITGVVIFLAHVVEYFIFSKKIKAKGDSPIKSFVMTMVFGIFYFMA